MLFLTKLKNSCKPTLAWFILWQLFICHSYVHHLKSFTIGFSSIQLRLSIIITFLIFIGSSFPITSIYLFRSLFVCTWKSDLHPIFSMDMWIYSCAHPLFPGLYWFQPYVFLLIVLETLITLIDDKKVYMICSMPWYMFSFSWFAWETSQWNPFPYALI